MSGFGDSPFGSAPYGLGTPSVATPLGGSVLRDAKTGESLGSRKIDPITKDYVLDSNGRILGMSDAQQLVYLAVSTTKGSAAMRTLGQELAKIDRISSNFLRRVETTLRAAVQHIVDRELIVVLGVTVETLGSGRAYASLRWRDTATGNEDVTRIAPVPRVP